MTTPVRPAPPRPAKPGQVKVFRAMYAYQAQHDDELSFEEGDMLYILDMSNKDWYKAKVGASKKTGLVPSNYVEESMEAVDNPLHEAAKRGNVEFLKECLNNNVSVNSLDKSGSTAIHWAANGGHVDVLKILFGKPRIELDNQNKLGDTALHAGAWKGHADVVKMLLKKGAKADVRNNEGKLAYDLASKDPATRVLLEPHIKRLDDEDYLDDEDSD